MGVVLALGLLGALPLSVAAGGGPSCGDTLTSDTTLTSNLNCSAYAGTALFMGKKGIVLNLNGHTITGYTGSDSYYGVDTSSYNHTKIKNGTITGFHTGVYVDYSSDTVVKKLTITGEDADTSDYGVYVYYGAANMMDKLTISGVYYGMYLEYSADNVVSNNNVTATDYGIETYYESSDDFLANVIHSDSYGFYDDYSGLNRWIGNTANGGSYGFYLDCDGYGRATVKNNVANNNSDYGFYIYYCYNDTDNVGSVVTGNTANGGDDYGFYDYYSINSTWMNNTANDNGGDGFYFDYPGGDVIKFNVAKRNGDDGFELEDNYSSGYYNAKTFSSNTSKNNTNYGFYASYGVPGSGNVASGNGSADCYSVSCI